MGRPVPRVAAIFDIHGNLPALEAVLDEIHAEGLDRIVVGGDIVPGPMPRESVGALLNLATPVSFIQGNGERDVLALYRDDELARVPESFTTACVGSSTSSPPNNCPSSLAGR